MKRLIISVLLLCLVALMAGPVYAGEGDDVPRDIRITISPFSGAGGDTISVSGSGADPSQSVIISLSSRPDTAEGALATVTVTPAADGTFSASLTVPTDIADGRYFVRGEQFTVNGNVMQYYYNTFAVGNVDLGTLLPVTGVVPGTSLTVTATLAMLLALALVARGAYALVTR
jgi:hypothetical protein